MTWNEPPLVMPNNNQTVWCRTQYYFSPPFQAVYRSQQKDFTSVVNSVAYPAWRIARWAAV